MSADEALRLITQGLYVVIFGVVAARAKRRPVRANVDIALFFAATALVIWLGWVTRALAVPPNRYLTAVSGAALMALPYLLLRLVDDFAGVLAALTAGLRAAAPALRSVWSALGQGLGLALGLAYFVGFAPPALLRRAWQEPELRAFLGRAAALPRLPTTEAIVRELERGTAA